MHESTGSENPKISHEYVVITRHPIVIGKKAVLGSIEGQRCARQVGEVVFAGPVDDRILAVECASNSRHLTSDYGTRSDIVPFMGGNSVFLGIDSWYSVQAKDERIPDEWVGGCINHDSVEAA